MKNSDHKARLDKLAKIPLFGAFKDNKESLTKISEICSLKEYEEGSVIIREGETGDDMFIVFEGKVEIRKNTRSGDEYTVVQLSAEHNVFFGEIAIVNSDGERTATVVAKSHCTFLVIKKDGFEKLCDEDPRIGLAVTREILQTVSGRLKKTNEDMLTIFDALVNEIKNS